MRKARTVIFIVDKCSVHFERNCNREYSRIGSDWSKLARFRRRINNLHAFYHVRRCFRGLDGNILHWWWSLGHGCRGEWWSFKTLGLWVRWSSEWIIWFRKRAYWLLRTLWWNFDFDIRSDCLWFRHLSRHSFTSYNNKHHWVRRFLNYNLSLKFGRRSMSELYTTINCKWVSQYNSRIDSFHLPLSHETHQQSCLTRKNQD